MALGQGGNLVKTLIAAIAKCAGLYTYRDKIWEVYNYVGRCVRVGVDETFSATSRLMPQRPHFQ